MEQKDYLMRQIEEAGRVLAEAMAKLTGFKNQGQVREGIEKTSLELQNQMDIGFQELNDLEADHLLTHLEKNDKIFPENYEKLAELLTEVAEGMAQQNKKEEAKSMYEKVLSIYQYLEEYESAFSFDRFAKMEKIRAAKDELQNK